MSAVLLRAVLAQASYASIEKRACCNAAGTLIPRHLILSDHSVPRHHDLHLVVHDGDEGAKAAGTGGAEIGGSLPAFLHPVLPISSLQPMSHESECAGSLGLLHDVLGWCKRKKGFVFGPFLLARDTKKKRAHRTVCSVFAPFADENRLLYFPFTTQEILTKSY